MTDTTANDIKPTDAAQARAVLVTESAAARIAELIAEEGQAGLMLRVFVSGGGCSGFQYGFSFDDQLNDDDHTFARDGIKVVVDDTSLDLLAFPCRHTDRVVVPVIDARKGEVFWAMYRQVPGGVQQVSPPMVGPVDDLVADLLARSQDALCVGDGAERYREEILEGFRCEISGPAHPAAGALVQLAHARALREEWVRPGEIEPVYLRAPDAQINWAVRGSRP